MRKRNAILLGSAFLLTVAGYVAWCWRPFYMPTKARYPDGSSKEVVAVVNQWRGENRLGMPSRFDRQLALEMLRHPWRNYRGQAEVRVIHSVSGAMEIYIITSEGCFLSEDHYLKKNGKWIAEKDPFAGFP